MPSIYTSELQPAVLLPPPKEVVDEVRKVVESGCMNRECKTATDSDRCHRLCGCYWPKLGQDYGNCVACKADPCEEASQKETCEERCYCKWTGGYRSHPGSCVRDEARIALMQRTRGGF